MYKAVVFDLDGTLIDSPLCFRTIRDRLQIPEEEFILEFLEKLPSEERAQKMKILEQIEFDAAQGARVFSGVIRLIERLRSAGIKTGIFTRNCRIATAHAVDKLNIHVDKIVTREDAKPKPDPEGLRLFLNEWQVQGNELLFVGDFRFDIECGKKAGVKTALFTNGGVPEPSWLPDHVFNTYEEWTFV